MEEILCCIGAAIFSILAVVLGVKRNIRNTKLGVGDNIRNSRERLDNALHDYQQLERDKERVQELDRRDDDNIAECAKISERIRKREPETSVKE